jgi:hypothetical protein
MAAVGKAMVSVHLRRQRSNRIWVGLLYRVLHRARVGNYPGSLSPYLLLGQSLFLD